MNSGADVECLGTGHLLEGLGWCKWDGVGVIPFCAPKNWVHRVHVFLRIPISFSQKRNNTEGINKSNIVYYQNDGKLVKQ